MTEKVSLKNDSIQRTMLGPLWARATRSHLYPGILEDPKAVEIVQKILEYLSTINSADEVSKAMKRLLDLLDIELLVRARRLDDAVKKYIEEHPKATVVNIAAGLETTFYRVDNGTIRWYDLDLPDAIEFRKQFLPDTQRSKCISKSAFDYSWMDDIEYDSENGIFFIAGGFLYYFSEDKVASFFNKLAEKFPEGEIAFDYVSKLALRLMNPILKNAGINASFSSWIEKPEKTIPKWSNKLEVVEWFTMHERTQLDPNWNERKLEMIKTSNKFEITKIIQVLFLK